MDIPSYNNKRLVFEIYPHVFKDERGYFFESFNHQKLRRKLFNKKINFVQGQSIRILTKGYLEVYIFKRGTCPSQISFVF